MTKEQYEGTPELIFYCEYNPHDFEDRLEIPFTNEYDIKLNFSRDEKTKEICINVNLQPKKSNVPKDFFGKNVLNVTAIAGKNGIGKTKVINILLEKKIYIKGNNSFSMYRVKSEIFIETKQVYRKQSSHIILLDNTCLSIKQVNNKAPEEIKYIYSDFISNINFSKYNNSFDCVDIDHSSHWNFLHSEHFSSFFRLELTKGIVLRLHNLCENKEIREVDYFSQPLNIVLGEYLYVQHRYPNNNKEIFERLFQLWILSEIIRELSSTLELCDNINRSTVDSIDNEYPDNNPIVINNYLGIIKNICGLEENIINHSVVKNINELSSETVQDKEYIKDLIIQSGELSRYSDNFNKILEYSHMEILFQNIDHSYFMQHGQLVILGENLNQYQSLITELLRKIDDIKRNKSVINIFQCQLGEFSDGERQLIETFSILHSALQKENKAKMVCIILDEPDSRLHPEWIRQYLHYFLEFLNIESEQLGIQFQIILTTHSPYLISDLPKENIILLEKDEKTGARTARKSNYGFASNYYDIMSDNFFLDDTIGEFAKQKINGCIQAINRISDDLDKLANDELILHDGLSLFIKESLENIEEQNKVIDLVGDKFIQKQLQQLLDSVKQRLLVHSDDSVRKQQLEQDIAELEERIRQKKMELNND